MVEIEKIAFMIASLIGIGIFSLTLLSYHENNKQLIQIFLYVTF